MSLFTNKTLLITGGTGSFGNAVLNRFVNSDMKEIKFSAAMKKNRMICGINYKMKNSNFI